MRRLFFTFAGGAPGIGLLIMRVVAGVGLCAHRANGMFAVSSSEYVVVRVVSIASGILLFLGLWTPIVGALALLEALWQLLARAGEPWPWLMFGTLGGALALIGPGAWSVDAQLFGWKRLKISDKDP